MADPSPVLADLRAESADLDALVAPLADWTLATPSPGWTIAHQVAHLAWTDDAALAAAAATTGDTAAWDTLVTAGLADPERFVDAEAERVAAGPRDELLQRWRRGCDALQQALLAVPDGRRLPWFGPPMSPTSMATARLMETWAHGQDVADAIGAERPATDRLRHVAHIGVRTRDFAFGLRGRTAPADEFRVELTGPTGSVWTWGPADAAQRVTGRALDFCLLVTQRRHRADLGVVAIGADADAWLDIAQAFAGAPGAGRSRS